ncbi:ABC transporter permease [Oceanobacillus sp. CAU 1775]
MWAVFKAQFNKDKRNPWTVLLFMIGSIVLTIVFAGMDNETEVTVPIFSNEANSNEVETKWEVLLNGHPEFNFVRMDEKEAREAIEEGNVEVVIQLFEHDYQLIAASVTQKMQVIEDYVHSTFTKEAQLRAVAGTSDVVSVRAALENYLENAPLQMEIESVEGGEVPGYNMQLQLLFGFTFFMAMFTIGFKVNAVTADKVSGVWDRLILSPVTKTKMYAGHLFYSFIIGFLQISIVLVIFNYILDYDLGYHFGMILAVAAVFSISMVSLAMLFTGFVKTPEQFYMVYPSIIPVLPIISGVYMPPGILTNPVLLFIADLFPLAHAIDALMDIAQNQATWTDIALPLSLMLLIGVVCMGIGINLVERRK